jgi:hypothetical protein
MRLAPLLALLALAACRDPAGDAPLPSATASSKPVASASAQAGGACDGGLGYGASCDGEGSGVGVPGKAHDPSAPRLEITLVSATAGLPGEIVVRVVKQSAPLFLRCYKDALAEASPAPQGEARLAFEIDAAGKAAGVKSAGGSFGSDVASCMTKVLAGASFPAPERAPVRATVEVRVAPP